VPGIKITDFQGPATIPVVLGDGSEAHMRPGGYVIDLPNGDHLVIAPPDPGDGTVFTDYSWLTDAIEAGFAAYKGFKELGGQGKVSTCITTTTTTTNAGSATTTTTTVCSSAA